MDRVVDDLQETTREKNLEMKRFVSDTEWISIDRVSARANPLLRNVRSELESERVAYFLGLRCWSLNTPGWAFLKSCLTSLHV